MEKTTFILAWFGSLTLIGACATQTARQPLRVSVESSTPAVCRIGVAGQFFLLPDDEAGLLSALADQQDKRRELQVRGDVNTPFRCIGHAIYFAQRAGFERAGFISEEASAKQD